MWNQPYRGNQDITEKENDLGFSHYSNITKEIEEEAVMRKSLKMKK